MFIVFVKTGEWFLHENGDKLAETSFARRVVSWICCRTVQFTCEFHMKVITYARIFVDTSDAMIKYRNCACSDVLHHNCAPACVKCCETSFSENPYAVRCLARTSSIMSEFA